MVELTISVPDELATRLEPVRDRVDEVLDAGLQQIHPKPSPLLQEIVEFLATGPSASEIIAFRASSETQEHIQHLLYKNSRGRISEREDAELDEISNLNHLMMMIQLTARKNMK